MSSSLLSAARAELVANGVVGRHQSHTRANNISKIRSLLDGDEGSSFGLSGMTRYSVDDVLSFLSELTGCSADAAQLAGEDTLDPDLTVDAIAAAAARLADAARRGATLFAGTGHPTGLLEHHMRVVDAYRRAGGKVVRPREEEKWAFGRGRAEVRYVAAVGCLAEGASLRHTHSPAPMEAVLDSEPWPEIVLGDHGFAGAAVERGIPAIAVMDINDHALAVAVAEGRDLIVLPMDDNRPPRMYKPSWRIFEDTLARV